MRWQGNGVLTRAGGAERNFVGVQRHTVGAVSAISAGGASTGLDRRGVAWRTTSGGAVSAGAAVLPHERGGLVDG